MGEEEEDDEEKEAAWNYYYALNIERDLLMLKNFLYT